VIKRLPAVWQVLTLLHQFVAQTSAKGPPFCTDSWLKLGLKGSDILLELCPRGNIKDVIIIILVYDNVYILC
jgi:hypothetical protein